MSAVWMDLEAGGVVEWSLELATKTSLYQSWSAGGGPTLRASMRWEVLPGMFVGVAPRYRFMFYRRYGISNTAGALDGKPRVHELDLLAELQFAVGWGGPRFALGPMMSVITNAESLRKPGFQSNFEYESPSGFMFDAGWVFGLTRSGASAIAISLSLAALHTGGWNSHVYLGLGYRYSLPFGS